MSNGCGPGWLPHFATELLFNWFFEASCNRHDEGYQEGGDEARRKVCDDKFLAAMLRDTQLLPRIVRPLAVAEAYCYYALVRQFGSRHFNYRRRV